MELAPTRIDATTYPVTAATAASHVLYQDDVDTPRLDLDASAITYPAPVAYGRNSSSAESLALSSPFSPTEKWTSIVSLVAVTSNSSVTAVSGASTIVARS